MKPSPCHNDMTLEAAQALHSCAQCAPKRYCGVFLCSDFLAQLLGVSCDIVETIRLQPSHSVWPMVVW